MLLLQITQMPGAFCVAASAGAPHGAKPPQAFQPQPLGSALLRGGVVEPDQGWRKHRVREVSVYLCSREGKEGVGEKHIVDPYKFLFLRRNGEDVGLGLVCVVPSWCFVVLLLKEEGLLVPSSRDVQESPGC